MDIRILSGATLSHRLENTRVAQLDVRDIDALDEAGCRIILESLLQHLVQSPWPVEPAPGAWTFFLVKEGEKAMLEHAIYQRAATFPGLHESINQLVRATAAGARRHRPWADAETPTGAAGASALALQDRHWIPAYLQYLRECDLDHEVHQGDELNAIVQTHGWNSDTLTLAAARLVGCCGQLGEEQVGEWYEALGLNDALASDEGLASFIAAAQREFSAWAPERPESHVTCRLELFEPYLPEHALEGLRTTALAAVG